MLLFNISGLIFVCQLSLYYFVSHTCSGMGRREGVKGDQKKCMEVWGLGWLEPCSDIKELWDIAPPQCLNISHFWGNYTVTQLLLGVHRKLIGCPTPHCGPPFIRIIYHWVSVNNILLYKLSILWDFSRSFVKLVTRSFHRGLSGMPR